ncbi:MAG: crossover junction endodeoxyribonuclease RuvC, partial [Acutalibacteraceae bacterium]
MIILGLDPGLAILGYGVIEVLPGKKMRTVDYGCVYTEAHTPLPDRLMKISDGIGQLFDVFKPDAVAMEELF